MTNNIKLKENTNLDEFKNNLKVARESRNITIEKASKLLNININIIKNLENGEFNKLTNDVFIKGHIRTYLKWLEIDHSLLIDDNHDNENIDLVIKKPKITISYKLKLSKFHIILISLMLFILIMLLYNNINKVEPLIYIDTNETQKTLVEDKTGNLSDVIIADSLPSNKEMNNKNITNNIVEADNYIYIKAIEDTWIEIQRNNLEVLITKVIKKDEELKVLYEKDLILVTGNAGSIIIHINDKIINNIGMPGEVKRNISLNYDDLIKFLNK